MSTEEKLSKLMPEFAHRVRLVIADLKAQGYEMVCVQGFRSFEEQAMLYAQGRTRKGKIVTKAKPGHSAHCYGLGADLVPLVNGQPAWPEPSPVWELLAHAAEKQGLVAGAHWPHFKDLDHIEMPGLAISECLSLYQKGGLPLVWQRAGEVIGVTPETQPQTPQTPQIKPLLSYGDGMIEKGFGLNNAVRELQHKLNIVLPKLGISHTLVEDGKFGTGTEKAIRLYQGKVGLIPDGRCGEATWKALEESLKV